METNQNIQTSVREFVKDNVLCAETFEDLSIDFCCGGDNIIETACRGKDLESEEVLCELKSLGNIKTEQVADLDSLTPAQLTLHIESKNHEYLKKVLPRISDLLDKVLSTLSEFYPELKDLKIIFTHFREDLEPHLLNEQEVLFHLM